MSEGQAPAGIPSLRAALWRLTQPHPAGFTLARWVVLRGIGVVFFSAFYSFAYQIQGLIGPHGISPANHYLAAARELLAAPNRYFEVPSLFWLTGAGTSALGLVTAAGLVSSALLIINCVPRIAVGLCTGLFLSIISVSGVFASYQSDGMLLEAGLFAFFFAPRGMLPRLGADSEPSRIARFMLVWEWFRIYFESGIVKLASGDPQWRNLTALDHYYENGPLPTWIGWYVQHLPAQFHAVTTAVTLFVELFLVWAAFLPRVFRLALFAFVTVLQVGIILTANYAFLNYLVLVLGFLLVDDITVRRALAFCCRKTWLQRSTKPAANGPLRELGLRLQAVTQRALRRLQRSVRQVHRAAQLRKPTRSPALAWCQLAFLALVFYASLLRFPLLAIEGLPDVMKWPAIALAPFRFANSYGLFAVMTRQRYEIEFQGTLDGETYIAYPFRYKPQDPKQPPGIYAPYQPRFEWNLWFASLGTVNRNRWVQRTAACLLRGEPAVLELFKFDPFFGVRPREIRTVVYRYWFSDRAARRAQGLYWQREMLGTYGPTMGWGEDGGIIVEP